MPVLDKSTQKIKEEGIYLYSFYESSTTPILKSNKTNTKKEYSGPIFLIDTDVKTPNKILANGIQQYLIVDTLGQPTGFYSKNVSLV